MVINQSDARSSAAAGLQRARSGDSFAALAINQFCLNISKSDSNQKAFLRSQNGKTTCNRGNVRSMLHVAEKGLVAGRLSIRDFVLGNQ